MIKKDIKTNLSIPASITIGTVICGILSVIGLFVITYLISIEKIQTDSIGHATMVVIVVSVLAGSFSAASLAKCNLLIVTLSTGATLIFLLLAVTAIFFDGQFAGMPVTSVLVLGCCLASALVATKMLNKKNTYYRKR